MTKQPNGGKPSPRPYAEQQFPIPLNVGRRQVQVRSVFGITHHSLPDRDHNLTLFCDARGRFYAVEQERDKNGTCFARLVRVLDGKEAMIWFARRVPWDAHLSAELVRAISQPEFEFMPFVPVGVKAPRKRKQMAAIATPAAGQFHEQLHMATALVESVRKLDAEPTLDNLTEACRSATALHQSMHAPENFKRAAAR